MRARPPYKTSQPVTAAAARGRKNIFFYGAAGCVSPVSRYKSVNRLLLLFHFDSPSPPPPSPPSRSSPLSPSLSPSSHPQPTKLSPSPSVDRTAALHPCRRNLVALCPSLANGTSTTQLLLMGSLLYSTKPGMRKRLGMDKILNPLAKMPGLRGWNLMPPRQIQRSGFAA
ncbi:hypothetical protein VPH35_122444 [Triticum aestivum]|uniref:Uncharacterized protein n=1 Tax=Triticum urartu TaxID=4572 RepID=A0A8R7V486_TRIUA